MRIMGIDPGSNGAMVILDSRLKMPKFIKMPLCGDVILFSSLARIFSDAKLNHIYLERAVSFGMGVKGAFTYGKSFATIEIAIGANSIPVTYVEPAKWTKEVCEGIDARLKPKERSLIAVNRIFPEGVKGIERNKNGKLHDGMVDALLIAEYGRRKQGGTRKLSPKDF